MNTTNNEAVRENAFDRQEVARLTRLAKGSRTLEEFAGTCVLSKGYLSRLMKGRLNTRPTRRTLAKIADINNSPENNVTLQMLLKAAGYEIDDYELGWHIHKGDGVPATVMTSGFPIFLTTIILESTRQLYREYEVKAFGGFFLIQSKAQTPILGIPAITAPQLVDQEIKDVRLRTIMALSAFQEDLRNAFIVIITNSRRLFDTFDDEEMPSFGGRFVIALTEDFITFSEQRDVKTLLLGETSENNNKSVGYYDLTKKL